jgi:hypothetical protein
MTLDWFKSERRKWATPIEEAQLRSTPTLPGFDARSRELYGMALPRGVLLPRLEPDRERVNYWMSPATLMRHRFQLGQIILGKLAGVYLGNLDDRPMVTIAGARAGKTSTVLEPNLYLYPGSMLVLDPKGELARAARFRRARATMFMSSIRSASRASRAPRSIPWPSSIRTTPAWWMTSCPSPTPWCRTMATLMKAVDLVCDDDDGARKCARRMVDGHDVELWQHDRRIEKFKGHSK